MYMRNCDVLCVGATSFDFVFRVARHPGPDEKTAADAFVRCGGGPAANAAVMVSRMGLQAAFAGYLGRDIFGDLHLEELQTSGVSTELIVRGELPTPLSSIWVKPSGERSLVNYRSGNAALSPAGTDFSAVHPEVILFDGHEPDLSPTLLDMARRENIKTVLDAGSLNKGTAFLFDKVDYLVCAQQFAREFTGISAPDAAIEALISHARCVVMTLGEEGLIWKTKAGGGRIPAFPVAAVDSTGAGDVFHGAFAGCLALGRKWDETLRYASAAAALSCTRLGGRTGIPSAIEVAKFLETYYPGAWRTVEGGS
jgi:sulfofructose kinase